MSPRFFVAPRTPIAAAGQSAERTVLLSSSGADFVWVRKQAVEFSSDLSESLEQHSNFGSAPSHLKLAR
jgi:hypothetical protein